MNLNYISSLNSDVFDRNILQTESVSCIIAKIFFDKTNEIKPRGK